MGANEERIKGAAEELKGKVKSAVGDVTNNEQLEAEGHVDQLSGQGRQEAAKAGERLKGGAEELKGNVKGAIGDLTGDEQTQAEGDVDKLKGQARQKANE